MMCFYMIIDLKSCFFFSVCFYSLWLEQIVNVIFLILFCLASGTLVFVYKLMMYYYIDGIIDINEGITCGI